MKNILTYFVAITLTISIALIPYCIIAIIWDFNPTNIEYFNLKLISTACVVGLMDIYLIEIDVV